MRGYFRPVSQALLLLLALLTPLLLKAKDESDGTQGLTQLPITSPSHIAIPKGEANDKCSEVLEWSEATGTLTAKITFGEVPSYGVVEEGPSDDRSFFFPFPAVKLDSQNNLVAERKFQKPLILGRLEERPPGTFRVVLRKDIYLQSHLHDGALTASLALTSSTR